jgi:hypothetical protein
VAGRDPSRYSVHACLRICIDDARKMPAMMAATSRSGRSVAVPTPHGGTHDDNVASRVVAREGPDRAHVRVANITGASARSGIQSSLPERIAKQNSSRGKQRLARISKMGNQYPRKLLAVGARARRRPSPSDPGDAGVYIT